MVHDHDIMRRARAEAVRYVIWINVEGGKKRKRKTKEIMGRRIS